jgi:glycosyltransferase involved in cell wall biosynthesis
MNKIAILFPAFWGGGADAVAAWLLQSLMNDYDLTLITFTKIDFGKIDRQYGTQLANSKIKVLVPFNNTFIPRLLDQKYKLYTVRQHLLAWYFRQIKNSFDLAISAFNEMDLGQPAMQYIHYPLFGWGHETVRHIMGYPDSFARRLYSRASALLLGYSDKRMRANLTITNSYWTAEIINKIYNIESVILYPLVSLSTSDTPWNNRENGFIYPTRIVPEKKIVEAINVVQKIRENNFDVHLHILSPSADVNYRQKILDIQKEKLSWLFINENLSREELAKMMTGHRYGIHMKNNEPFGIALAEMVQAGCITFAPLIGGQSEIVGDIPALKFQTNDEAVEKICSVLSDPRLQTELQNQLSTRKNLFTPEKFCNHLTSLVDQAFK